MKSSITEYIIGIFELFEAEVKSLKKGILNLFISIGFIFVAIFLLFVAFIFIAMGVHDFYATLMLSYQADFATAGTFILLSVLILGAIKWMR